MKVGFSTGSLAFGDFNKALSYLQNIGIAAVELSALRESELPLLLESMDDLDLRKYSYISFHAPSKLEMLSEQALISLLEQVVHRDWHIVVHPDIISDFEAWKVLGRCLCIENMDKRKPIGRTTADLDFIFARLPEASFCMDLAHARQVDPTMIESYSMLSAFRSRLVQFHISDVTSGSSHVPLNVESVFAYRKLDNLIPPGAPFIIESPVTPNCIQNEVDIVKSIFSNTSKQKRNPLYQFGNTW